MSNLILYTSPDGRTRLDLQGDAGTVWLTQLEIAELFQTTKQNVSLLAKNIFEGGELSHQATVKESLTVQNEGKREVQRALAHYNLDLILSRESFKDPYRFDFLVLTDEAQERAIENALRGNIQPIGVAEYQLVGSLPTEPQTSLPSIVQIERELSKGDML